jgi:hypothetical protein
MALASLIPFSRRVRELVRFGSSVGCTLQTSFSTLFVVKVWAIDQLVAWAPKKRSRRLTRGALRSVKFGFEGTVLDPQVPDRTAR